MKELGAEIINYIISYFIKFSNNIYQVIPTIICNLYLIDNLYNRLHHLSEFII